MVVVAVDMGASKIKSAIITSTLVVDFSLEVPTQYSKGKDQVIQYLVDVISATMDHTKKKISAIGISMPGIVVNGELPFVGGNLHFLENAPIQSLLEKKFKLPVLLANDADCFAVAESTFGAAKEYNKIFVVIWGSGIGSGIVVKTNAKTVLLSGSELGHMKIFDSYKNKFVDVETCAGGLAVEKEYKKLTGKKSSMKEIYSSKDAHAKLLVKRMISSLAFAIASSVQILNPDIVVLGGGVSNLPVLNLLKSEVKKYLIPLHAKKLLLKRFEIGDDSGLFGAAILALGENKK